MDSPRSEKQLKAYWAQLRESMTPEEWRAFHKKWRDDNIDHLHALQRAYYARNKETILAGREIFNARAVVASQKRRDHYRTTPHSFKLMITAKGPRCVHCSRIETNAIHGSN